ncbi:Beta-porphyranase A [Paraglaciecola mesophila]|uniref:Beta-porphyranase A n=1 Tax=Paraglaciecola mesophila TaxID=197222 RepID=A0A857JKE0_9ALTE|nr:family 16 glycosylhydrolase [Paraglaciecola mesophila]QHJ11600.1 Beta-porphyranase A [Paraglaciecola mesophila]
MHVNLVKSILIFFTAHGMMGCQIEPQDAATKQVAQKQWQNVVPLSDPDNLGGWVLNSAVSDEFSGSHIDASKWFVQGEENEYYIWKGRAPSQFAAHNVTVQGGLLKLKSQWEPDFVFANENYADGNVDSGYGVHEGKPLPVTTAAIVSHERFLHGYMEVRSKAIDAAMTSAFWTIGYQSELDIYEQMGRPKIRGNIREDYVKSTVHDWRPPAKRPTWAFQHSEQYPFRVADEFHVYGAEWGEGYLKLYTDGKLIYSTTQEALGDKWVLTNPMEIWLDSEIFQWLGMPHKEELPGTFEVDYVRVWQKPQTNLLQPAFYGFEGPYIFSQYPKPLLKEPARPKSKAYQQFWQFPGGAAKHASLVYERATQGKKSLKIEMQAADNTNIEIVAPKGSVNIPKGEYQISFDTWLQPGSTLQQISIALTSPQDRLDFALQDVAQGQWVNLQQKISHQTASAADDALTILVDSDQLASGKSTLFIDNVAIEEVK